MHLFSRDRSVVVVAVKAAVAAGAAFYLGSLVPSPMSDYNYYAALGAFTVVGLVVVESVKESWRVLGAVSVGVVVALVVQEIAWTNSLTVAFTILLGTLLGALPIFGEQRTWAPLAGLFVLATGGPDPQPMALGYLVQVPLGAAVGVVVNLVLLAPLGIHDLERATSLVLRLLPDQMRSYAEVLTEPESDDRQQQAEEIISAKEHELVSAQSQLRSAVTQAHQARRGNPWARRGHGLGDLERAQAIGRCAAALGAINGVLAVSAPAEREEGTALRRAVADMLSRSADAMEDFASVGTEEELLESAQDSIDDLLAQVRTMSNDDGLDHLLFGALAVTLQACLDIFARDVAPSQG